MNGICISGGKRDKRNNHLINEDYIICNNKYKIILDGSTGLGDNYIDSYYTSAEWYVRKLAEYLSNNLDNCNNCNDIKMVVAQSIDYMANLVNNKIDINLLSKYEKPSCSLMILYELSDKIIIFKIGDILAFIKKKNISDIEIIRDNVLNELDSNVFNLMKDISNSQGISVKEARNDKKVNDLLIENRSKMNEDDGYYIVSFESLSVEHADIYEYSKKDIEKIFICSDGFYFDALNISYNEFMDNVNNDNLNSYYEIIKNNLLNDSTWQKYSNRFKDLDDVSALVAYDENID